MNRLVIHYLSEIEISQSILHPFKICEILGTMYNLDFSPIISSINEYEYKVGKSEKYYKLLASLHESIFISLEKLGVALAIFVKEDKNFLLVISNEERSKLIEKSKKNPLASNANILEAKFKPLFIVGSKQLEIILKPDSKCK